ncbi:MAG: pseudouridine synthase [Kangiella sp.]|nr:MAG: pseudouridine synthase [Kangiella sp.]
MVSQRSLHQTPLTIKQGVSPSCLYLNEGNWKTIFEYFCSSFPHISHEESLLRFSQGEVRFEDGRIISPNTPFKRDVKIFYYRELPSEIKVPFEEKVIFENERFLIVDKPHFLPVAPSGEYLHETLIVRLRNKLKLDELELCHRLDRETAGLVLVIKKQEYRAKYHRLFSERNITKVYHAISNLPSEYMKFPIVKKSYLEKSTPFYLMQERLNYEGSDSGLSESKIELIKIGLQQALYKLTPKTGKKHQLRIHMASVGLPIVNDVFYPKLLNRETHDFSKPLQLLAKSLHFKDPYTGENYCFDSDFELSLT